MSVEFLGRSLYERLIRGLFGGPSMGVFRGMATLTLGSSLAQATSLAAIPILTRLYSPEDLGVLSIFTALVAILAPLATLRYAVALPLPRHDGTAVNLLVLSTGVLLIFSVVVAFLLWVGGMHLLHLLSMENLASWWWLIVLGISCTAIYDLLTMWATRRLAYKTIAKTNVLQSLSAASLKIVLGLMAVKPLGLLLGQVMGQTIGLSVMLRFFCRDLYRNWRHVRWQRVCKVAIWYRDFPFYRVPSQFVMVLTMQSPLLLVAAFYDPETTGQLGLAMMAVSLPITLIGRTTAKAFYAEAAKCGVGKADEIKAIFVAVVFRLGAVSLFPGSILLFFGDLLFVTAFGDEWSLAGVFASILSVCLMFQFIQTPVAYVFLLLNGQKDLLFISIQRLVLTVLAFGMAPVFALSPSETLIIFSAVLSIHYAASTYYAYRHISTAARRE